MPFSESPESIPFVIFLLLFVLSGLYPAWKKSAALIRKALKESEQGKIAQTIPLERQALPSVTSPGDLNLSDFEGFVFWQMVQNEPKSLTRRQLTNNLHLEPKDLKPALLSLAEKGLIYLEISSWFRLRYRLAEKGYRYAAEQGYITARHIVANG